MSDIQVVLVTPDDTILGTTDKITAHRYAMLHRAFSVFIYRFHQGAIEILLQQRQINKYHCGGLWSNSCCSHPFVDEEITSAGERRLQEELGIQSTLQTVGRFHYVAALDNHFFENELDYVLAGTTNDADIHFNPEEVSAVQWITISDLQQWLKMRPEQFTPWFQQAFDLCKDYLASQIKSDSN
ncbi:isopentenyl-diphosphate Delta-isomerase [Legionella fairfieldensis]|uniref:isopentenyl-diphosphate Delta-isomerase n=1 Tax=Legionella fairfieldensis TaxID=45064 RepID=UPI00048B2252|nr:isopentenyl-diphosphate Delta-isomerase [Legionella fairfieldensis]